MNKILCPNLRLGVSYNLISPDEEGWVLEEDLRDFLKIVGVDPSSILIEVLIGTAISAVEEKRKGYVNIHNLENTFLDHGSSSGVLHGGFSEERLDHLKTFMVQGRLDLDGISKACKNFHKCPFKRASLLGTNIHSFEMANFLEIYGRGGEGSKYFTEQDIDNLWKHNKFPDGWKYKEGYVVGTWKSLVNWGRIMWRRVKC